MLLSAMQTCRSEETKKVQVRGSKKGGRCRRGGIKHKQGEERKGLCPNHGYFGCLACLSERAGEDMKGPKRFSALDNGKDFAAGGLVPELSNVSILF
jgi:hypothetical protein